MVDSSPWDPSSEFGGRIERLLRDEALLWITHVNSRCAPVTNAVWFMWDGTSVIVYNQPTSLRVRALPNNPKVTVHFNSDFHGLETTIIAGRAEVAETLAADRSAYFKKYEKAIEQLHLGVDFFESYSVPVKIVPTRSYGY